MNRPRANPHEELARREKALALLVQLDRQASLAGVPPLAGADGAQALRSLSRKTWGVLSRAAKAIDLVVQHVERRGVGPRLVPRQQTLPEVL